jgi:hypothetical protein
MKKLKKANKALLLERMTIRNLDMLANVRGGRMLWSSLTCPATGGAA